jgi:hypothetical protein
MVEAGGRQAVLGAERCTLRPVVPHGLIQRRHCRSFRSFLALPGAMMVPSFRRDYTTAVKDAIRRTETQTGRCPCLLPLAPRHAIEVK